MTNPSRKALVKKLDTLVSTIIRATYGHCIICGKTDSLTNGHLFSRTSYATRWDIEAGGNCACQCAGCNLRHVYDPYPYLNWYVQRYGQANLDALHARFVATRPYKTWQLTELYEKLHQHASTTK